MASKVSLPFSASKASGLYSLRAVMQFVVSASSTVSFESNLAHALTFKKKTWDTKVVKPAFFFYLLLAGQLPHTRPTAIIMTRNQ